MKRNPSGSRIFALGLAVPALLLAASSGSTPEGELCPELAFLQPFIGTWIGEFEDATERPDVLRAWTPILGGQAVRETRTVAEVGFEAESLYYYDREAGVVAYIGITNNGYMSRGQIVFDGEEFVQSGEQTQPDASQDSIRVTYRFVAADSLVNRLYNSEGGEWRPGHTIIYTARSGT